MSNFFTRLGKKTRKRVVTSRKAKAARKKSHAKADAMFNKFLAKRAKTEAKARARQQKKRIKEIRKIQNAQRLRGLEEAKKRKRSKEKKKIQKNDGVCK